MKLVPQVLLIGAASIAIHTVAYKYQELKNKLYVGPPSISCVATDPAFVNLLEGDVRTHPEEPKPLLTNLQQFEDYAKAKAYSLHTNGHWKVKN